MTTPEPHTTPYNTRSRSQSRDKIDEVPQPKDEPPSPPQPKRESPFHYAQSTDDTTEPANPWRHETIAQPPINTTDTNTLIISLQTSMQQLTQYMQTLHVETQDNLHLLHERLEQQQLEQQRLSTELLSLRTSAVPAAGSSEIHIQELKHEIQPQSIKPHLTSTSIQIPVVTTTTNATTKKADELPKMPIKMKEFSGHDKDQNVQSWVDQLTTIKRIQNWSDDVIIKHCAMLLSDSAQRWYLSTGHLMTENWKRFSKELIKRFTVNINPWMATRYTQDIKQKGYESARDFMDRVQRELRLINIDSEERVCEVFLNGARDSIASGIIRSIGREAVESKELVEIACRLEMAERMERDSHKRQAERTASRPGSAFIPPNNSAYNAGTRLQLGYTCFNCGDTSHRARECPRPKRAAADPSAARLAPATALTAAPNVPKPRSFQDWKASVRCHICNAIGHTKNYCPKNRQPNTTTMEKKVTTSTSTSPKPGGVIRTVNSIQCESDMDEPSDTENTELDPQDVDLEEEVYDEDMLDQHQVFTIGNPSTSQSDKSYIVTGYANGKPVQCTIDCGATCSCIEEGVFASLPERSRKDFTATTNKLSTANGSNLVVTGSANIPLRMKSNDGVKEMIVKFHIVKKLTAPCLLGTDFTNKYGAGMMWTKGRRHLILKDGSHVPFWEGAEQTTETGRKAEKKSEHRVMLIRLERDLVLKASSATCFPGAYCLPTSDDPIVMTHGSEALLANGVLVASTLHKSNNQGKRSHMVLQVTNTGTKDIMYNRGQVIGTAEPVELMELQEQQEITQSQDVQEQTTHDIEERIDNHEPEHSAINTPQQRQTLCALLSRFSHLFDNRSIGEARHAGSTVEHVINTSSSPPVRAHPYRQSPAIEASIQKEIDKLLSDGVIEHSNSPWASPIVMVKKKDGTWRMCIDYRKLNAVTVPDVYPLPAIDQMLYNMTSARVFTTMDLQSAYNQILVDKEDQPKTAFIHRTGLYQYRRMPFGLRNAPATFQRFMNMMFATSDENMWIYVMVYLDDVIIFSVTIDEHMVHVAKVLCIISRHGLKLKLSKCEFAKIQVRYLGHILNANGVQVDPDKVAAVKAMPAPTKVVELQSFLGMVGYYRKFIAGFAKIAQPLVHLLNKGTHWEWTEQCQKAIDTFKHMLTSAPVLAMPSYTNTEPFIVQTDASVIGIGAVLSQRQPQTAITSRTSERPIAYISRTLKKHEKNYSITHLELLAVIWALKKFRHYILGTKFIVQTDHIALQTIRNTKEIHSGRMARWVLALQEYEPFEVQYRKGSSNGNADALSRLPLPHINNNNAEHRVNAVDEVNQEEKYDDVKQSDTTDEKDDSSIGSLQQQDTQWTDIYGCVNNPDDAAWDDKLRRECEQYVIHDGILYRRYLANNKAQTTNLILQLCLPQSMITTILKEMHDEPYSGHLGTEKTWTKIFNRYYWKQMREDIAHYCASCDVCARRNVPKHVEGIPMLSPQLDFISLYGPMECIAIDIIGPITTSNRASLILTVVDVYTRYGVAIPVLQQTAQHVIQALVKKWFVIYGFPRTIMSDNGPGFASHEMKACMKAMGVTSKYVLPYHAQSNGICERLNATIINAVKSYIQDPKRQNRWSEYLTQVLFAYNTATHPSTGYTPFYLVYGREAIIGSETVLRIPPHDFQPYPTYVKNIQRDMWIAHHHIQDRVKQRADAREQVNSEMKSIASFITGDQVMVYQLPKSMKGISAKLLSPYIGPCTVKNQYNDVSYQVKRNDNNKIMVVHVSRMKRYTQRDKDLHEALAQANAEAARDAAGVAVLPLERNVDDDIDNTVSGSTRSRVPRQHQPRTQRVRIKWWKSSDSVPSTAHNNIQQQEEKDEESISSQLPSSAPPRKRVIDISDDSDIEEGEVRYIHLRRQHHHHQHQY